MTTMTNKHLGNLIGCTHSMASRLRAGKRLPGSASMLRISAALQIPADTLLTAYGEGPAAFAWVLNGRIAEIDALERATTAA
jgi:transcriptional regulator with XRE-family HTH domain